MEIKWEEISFGIIAQVGEAKGLAFKAIELAKASNFDDAFMTLNSANQAMGKAGHLHMDVIAAEAQGQKLIFPVLFMHAEDQLLSGEAILLMAQEVITLYQKIQTIAENNSTTD